MEGLLFQEEEVGHPFLVLEEVLHDLAVQGHCHGLEQEEVHLCQVLEVVRRDQEPEELLHGLVREVALLFQEQEEVHLVQVQEGVLHDLVVQGHCRDQVLEEELLDLVQVEERRVLEGEEHHVQVLLEVHLS